MNVPELVLAFWQIIKAGGFTTGGLNFDAKIRRQSIDPEDLLQAHVGSMDACARAFLVASKMIEEGALELPLKRRYEGWDTQVAQKMMQGQMSLEQIADHVNKNRIDPQPRSGRQERLESIINDYL
jgi:xylose isomerase